jgi:predicted TIM-barrel fold metal-dependent hydrolase
MNHLQSVDSHAHVFAKDLPLAPVRRHAPDYDALIEEYLAQLDRVGVSRGVLVQPSFLGTDNSYFLAALRRFPDRLRGVAVVSPQITSKELHAMAEQGVVGIRLNLVGLPIPELFSEEWKGLLKQVRDLDWHVEVHREARDLPALIPPLIASGCKIVIDHFGRPDPTLGADDPGFKFLLEHASTGQVWVKLSAAYRTWGAEQTGEACSRTARALLASFGPHRLMWASDWPNTQHQHLVDYDATWRALDCWVKDEKQRRIILADTPMALFKF